MPRNKSLIPLSHDHYHGLRLAQMLKKNMPAMKRMPEEPLEKVKYTVEFYNSDLVKHFQSEEEILFPFVIGRDTLLDGMIKEAIQEHKKIKEYIDQLNQSNDLEKDLDQLGRLLESHIRKEERFLFPQIQLLVPEDELKEIEGRITAVKQDNRKEK